MLEKTINTIKLEGVRANNLKNIDIEIPKNKITTITGVSGSGKSSLAFDTIYKEGQYRYIESLSSYLRQFFNLGTRPEIDYSEGLSPAIAIEQNKKIGNSRSTVGTLTELDDYIRLLFAKLGNIYCWSCGKKIEAQTIDQIIGKIKEKFLDKKIYLLVENKEYDNISFLKKFVKKNRKEAETDKGFIRYLVQSHDKKKSIEYFYLEEPVIPEDFFPVKVFGIYDRITIEKKTPIRLKEDIIKILSENPKFGVMRIDNQNEEIEWYTEKNFCASCNIEYPEFTTQHFSPNRQEGACPKCHGLGEVLQVDFDKIIDGNSNYLKSILPWRDSKVGQSILEKLANKYDINTTTKFDLLPKWFQELVISGDGENLRINIGGKFVLTKYEGIEPILTEQYSKGLLTVDFQAMLEVKECPECLGSKLKKESLNVFLELKKSKKDSSISEKVNIHTIQKSSIDEVIKFINKFEKYHNKSELLVSKILNPLKNRLTTIQGLGLGYISTNRKMNTLSGGEIQRLRLAKQLGNKLTGIIYVLDEPTIGLDKKEVNKTIKAIKQLKEIGNTIVVVEHNDIFIKNSDWIIEIGPGGGDFGGKVLFSGEYSKFLKSKTLTAEYITGKKEINIGFDHTPMNKFIEIKKANKYNLKDINIKLQLGSFTILTGSSGSGKTTLLYHILYKFLSEKQKIVQSFIRLKLLKDGYSWSDIISAPIIKPEEYSHYENLAIQEFFKNIGVDTIRGTEEIDNILYVNQTSIGKTPRSCPATFIGVFDDIRKLFAGSESAKLMGFTGGHFSFNSSKGACPECDGYGEKKIELQFLPNTYVSCDLCKGKRYKPEILKIKWKGVNMSDVLSMYVYEALEFFQDINFIHEKLELMNEIGLGYLKMGQPAHTLSGGESQRLKLVKHLLKSYKGHTVYFLDEPTVGLHPEDIQKLLKVIKKFLDNGSSIFMIEHDQSLLKFADSVITLEKGRIVEK